MYYIVNQTFDLFSIPRTTPASAAILVLQFRALFIKLN
jgi:hypothetical protein